MLVIDTSLKTHLVYQSVPNGSAIGIYIPPHEENYYDYSSYWQKGYSVFSYNSGKMEYLDADKKPLSKNIIVWTYLKIN